MSAFSSDLELDIQDVTGNGVEVDVATNTLTGTVRLSVLWTQEIFLSADDAEQVAQSLLRAAERVRRHGPQLTRGPYVESQLMVDGLASGDA
ncbi:hypothetical protein [Streptomyces sp. NPDC005408]|uniref:hypothetical protein n=1 Tax=Streptomyces sp. NPDC005408 TaxID=3155341 RepID=UPI0033BD5A6E